VEAELCQQERLRCRAAMDHLRTMESPEHRGPGTQDPELAEG
jgi:hypothetical protein